MSESLRMSRRQKKHGLAAALAALLLVPLAPAGFAAQATATGSASQTAQPASGSPSTGDNGSQLSGVTIEGARQHALRLKVDHFVASVVAPSVENQSLLRWNKPVCPLVVGLPRNMGEFILQHISQAARDAHAPLAGSHCEANLFIVVTPQPDDVLKQWMARNPRVDTRHGTVPLKNFLGSKLPVRVWYEPESGCVGGGHNPRSAATLNGITTPGPGLGKYSAAGSAGGMGPMYCDNSMDTHLTYGDVRSISYAIVVADSNQLHQNHVTVGQLADYASLVGLADVRLDSDGGGEPTILQLFHDAKAPQSLTPWDRALLYSLYNTTQSVKLQVTDMEMSMTQRITP